MCLMCAQHAPQVSNNECFEVTDAVISMLRCIPQIQRVHLHLCGMGC